LTLLLGLFLTGWWMTEPLRWVQTNLRQTDASVDARQLVSQAADLRANVLHFSVGGIVAFYPTKVPFHYPPPHLKGDLLGDVIREAHARKIRVVGRFDLSKTQKAVFDAHPEWFFRKADGQPVIYNGLYSTCINGGWYRGHAMKILAEALERYELDGLFFNMFGNQSRDYSGNFVGHCHCDSCKRLYREWYKAELPKEPDDQYRQFMFRASREVAAEIGKLIRAKRPQAGYFNYIQEHTDGIMSESNTAVNRPLWPYTSSDNVNRARNSEPTKMSVNLCMQFVDYAWRFATVPAHEIALRLWQNVAHGGALALAINGTFDQQDQQALDAAKPVFRWIADREQYYSRQESAARVVLLGAPASLGRGFQQASYRGMFRLLTEEHIPFAVTDNLNWRPADLVISTGWAPSKLLDYARDGGKVLLVTPEPPEFPLGQVVKRWPDMEGYARVRQPERFASLARTKLLMIDGPFTELAGDGPLTLVPPSMIGPPEYIHIDQQDTAKPAMMTYDIGKGRIVWIPWDAAGLYMRHSLPAHAGLLRDAIDSLMTRRQIRTNAHPLVEMSLMRQQGRTLLHLVNVSGHSQSAYHAPLPMSGIDIAIDGRHASAKLASSGAALPVEFRDGYSRVKVPMLDGYELIELTPSR
jgi:hypothetical protein